MSCDAVSAPSGNERPWKTSRSGSGSTWNGLSSTRTSAGAFCSQRAIQAYSASRVGRLKLCGASTWTLCTRSSAPARAKSLRISGYSTRGVSFVESPVAEIMRSGRGAIVAASSTLLVSRRSPGGFSHRHPPCMCSEIMFTGTATFTRSSTAARRKVCVPPPDAPAAPMRSGSTSGRDWRKSRLRMPFQSCRPARLSPHRLSRRPPNACVSWRLSS